MFYCKQCGIKLEQDTKFCPSCGTVVSDQPKEDASAYTPPIVPKTAVKPDEKDVQDVLLLCETFGIPVPEEYRD